MQDRLTALCFLDLAAAFDTVDHQVLLQRLQRSFEIEDCALAWYTARTCVVYVGVSFQLICSCRISEILEPLHDDSPFFPYPTRIPALISG